MKKILNSNSLKIVAISSMLLDHIAYLFIPVLNPLYHIFRVLGRICAPIMFYGIAKGFHYTSNKMRYGKRLLLFAIISQVPYSLFLGDKWFLFDNYNVLFTLFLSFLTLWIFTDISNKILKYSLILLCLLLSKFCDWGMIGVIITFVFYLFRSSQYKYVAYSGVCMLYLVVNFLINNSLYNFLIYLGLFLVIPLLYLDNGNKGKYNLKYLFYCFYPLHLLILFIIKIVVL